MGEKENKYEKIFKFISILITIGGVIWLISKMKFEVSPPSPPPSGNKKVEGVNIKVE